MDYSNFYLVSEFVRVNWKTCQVFPWEGERFVTFSHLHDQRKLILLALG